MTSASRYHDFSSGHRVVGHESKCRHLHGHNYRAHFECSGDLDSLGRVIDFGVIKTTLCQWLEDNWDHKTLLWDKDPLLELLDFHEADVKQLLEESVVVVPFNPTAENMARYLVECVGVAVLPEHITLTSVRLEETRKCAATYIQTP